MESTAAASAAAAAGGRTVDAFFAGSLMEGTELPRVGVGLSRGAGAGMRGGLAAGLEGATAGGRMATSREAAADSSGSTDLDQGEIVGSAWIHDSQASPLPLSANAGMLPVVSAL